MKLQIFSKNYMSEDKDRKNLCAFKAPVLRFAQADSKSMCSQEQLPSGALRDGIVRALQHSAAVCLSIGCYWPSFASQRNSSVQFWT